MPTVRFLVHGAERSGPPVYVLRVLRFWDAHPPSFDREVVLARPGPLLDEFVDLVPTRVARLDQFSPDRRLGRLARVLGSPLMGTARADAVARSVTATLTRFRVGGWRSRRADRRVVTVVNGATSNTCELLRRVRVDGPVVLIAHELSTGWQANIDSVDRELLLRRCRKVLAVSEAVRRYLVAEVGFGADRVHVLPPPVPECALLAGNQRDRLVPADRGNRAVVGGGGVTDWRKAPDLWLLVARGVLDRLGPDRVSFVWFGGESPDGVAFWPLRHEIDHLGLADSVEFLGPVDDVSAVLDRCDVFVSTAREDANPLVCAEAAGRGVPVVSFDSGGVEELVEASGCGRIVGYPDLDGLVDAVVDLLNDDSERSRCGSLGSVHVAAWLSDRVVVPGVEEWIMESFETMEVVGA